MKDVRMYTTQACPFCIRAKEFLTSKGVPYEEVDVTGDDAARLKLVELSQGRKTVPQIFIGGMPIGGFSDLMELHTAGKLEAMLESPLP